MKAKNKTNQTQSRQGYAAEVAALLDRKRQDPLLKEIERITQDSPELTIQLIRAWLKEDN